MKPLPAEPDDHSGTERWTVSYADFMTLLFALFVVLFASSRHDRKDIEKVSSAVRDGFQQLGIASTEAGNAAPVLTAPRLPGPSRGGGIDVAALQNDLTAALGKQIARSEVVLRATPDGFVISLRELGFFHSGEATMFPGAAATVQRIGQILTRYGLDMRIEGHTDDVPIHTATFSSNWQLSTARANSVAIMLIDRAHFDPAHLSIAGYGQYHPVEANDTPQGRQANRRVDIVIVSTIEPADDGTNRTAKGK